MKNALLAIFLFLNKNLDSGNPSLIANEFQESIVCGIVSSVLHAGMPATDS